MTKDAKEKRKVALKRQKKYCPYIKAICKGPRCILWIGKNKDCMWMVECRQVIIEKPLPQPEMTPEFAKHILERKNQDYLR